MTDLANLTEDDINTNNRKKLLNEIFDLYDEDESGTIDVCELGTVVRAMGYAPSERQVQQLLERFDKNADGVISRPELWDMIVAAVNEGGLLPEAYDEDALLEAFKAFDKDGSGSISRKELLQALTSQGEALTMAQAKAMIEDVDDDDDGELDYHEFVRLMVGRQQQAEAEEDEEAEEEEAAEEEDQHEEEAAENEPPQGDASGSSDPTAWAPGVSGETFDALLEPLYAAVRDDPELRVMLDLEAAKKAIDQIIKSKKPFVDASFPPCAKSINRLPYDMYPSQSFQNADKIPWYRGPDCVPKEAGPAALIKDGTCASDICQGGCGNCYMIGEIAGVAEREDIVRAMFYPNQLNASGIYGLKLWVPTRKEWRMLIVDDYLPTTSSGKFPIFAKSTDPTEIWSSLAEKAMAKINGSYQGNTAGMGLIEVGAVMTGSDLVIECPESADATFAVCKYYLDRRGIISTGTGKYNSDGTERIVTKEEGLVQGHAYTMLRVAEHGGIRLIKLRNTWGGFEWKGDFSDSSDKWKQHPELAKLCKVEASDDGSFWMTIEDFFDRFGGLRIFFPGFSPMPEHRVMEADYCWRIKHLRKEGELMKNEVEQIITSPGGFDTAYNLAESPQFSFTVTKRTNLKILGDRKRGGLGAEQGEGGAVSLMLFRKPAGSAHGRIVYAGFVKEKGLAGDEQPLLTSFIDWSPDFECEPGTYTLVPYVHNTATYPVVVKVASNSPPPLTLIPPLRFVTARSKMHAGVPGFSGDSQTPQFLLDVKKAGVYVVEGMTDASFDAFNAQLMLLISISSKPDGRPYGSAAQAQYPEGDATVAEGGEWYTRHVGVKVDLQKGKYVVAIVFHQSPPLPLGIEAKVTSVNGDGNATLTTLI